LAVEQRLGARAAAESAEERERSERLKALTLQVAELSDDTQRALLLTLSAARVLLLMCMRSLE